MEKIREALDFDDVLIEPQLSNIDSRNDVILEKEYPWFYECKFNVLPVAAANIDGIGTLSMARSLTKYKMLTFLKKSYSPAEIFNYVLKYDYLHRYIVPTVGLNYDEVYRVIEYLDSTIFNKILNIDVANGYTKRYRDFINTIHCKWPDWLLVAGNVCTYEGAVALINAGATFVKVGLGSGSLCTTRIKTGIGVPQLTAIMDCVYAARSHGKECYIISDGGCRTPGDIAKAFAAGADIVMCGGIFAGCEESEEPIVDGKIKVYGMSSDHAMLRYKNEAEYKTSEGRVVEIPARGPVENIVKDILGGLRSTCSYTNSRNLEDLANYTTLIKVNRQYNKFFE